MDPNKNFILGKNKKDNKDNSIQSNNQLFKLNIKDNLEKIKFNKKEIDKKEIDKKEIDTKNNENIHIQKIEDKIISHIRYLYITYNYVIVPFDNDDNLISISPIELQSKIIEKTKTSKVEALIMTNCSQQLEKYLNEIQEWNAQIMNIMILFNKYQISNNLDKCNNIIEYILKKDKNINDDDTNNIDDSDDADEKDLNLQDDKDKKENIKIYLEDNSFLIIPIKIVYDSLEEQVDLNDRIFIYLPKLLWNYMTNFKLQINSNLYIKMFPYFKYE